MPPGEDEDLPSRHVPGAIVLEAVTGSHAYGLATETSDVDLKAVYVADTDDLLSLSPPKDTLNWTQPDYTVHEVGKFVRLALACNPTVLEILFLENYEVLAYEGELLKNIRYAFLSQRIYDTYGGYAYSQAKRLEKRGGESFSADTRHRYAKHARHCFRLLQQGRMLLETGDLNVVVPNRDEIFAVGELAPDDLIEKFEREYEVFKNTPTKLPAQPDREKVQEVLLTIRHRNYPRRRKAFTWENERSS